MTTRTARVVVVKSSAKGIATVHATATGAPAAIVIGTATPAKANAAAVSPYQDRSRPLTIAIASNQAGMAGTTNDHRMVESVSIRAATPDATPTAPVQRSHRMADTRRSRVARAPRCPSAMAAGSCARKPATLATANSAPAVDGPPAISAVTRGKASCPYAPCSLGNRPSDLFMTCVLTNLLIDAAHRQRSREQNVVFEVHVDVHGGFQLRQAVVQRPERLTGPLRCHIASRHRA